MGTKNHDIRLSAAARRVLETLLDNPHEALSGLQIGGRTGLSAGTLYPVLLRLESAGWCVSRWEAAKVCAGHPRRRLYRLTPTGVARASALPDGMAAGCRA